MKILIAEDDSATRLLLQSALTDWGYDVLATSNGAEALAVLRMPKAPSLAILDWVMPKLDGVEVCRKVREDNATNPPYLMLLTAQNDTARIVEGLLAGANDYVTKPFDEAELRARVQVGERMVQLQSELAERVRELEASLVHVKQLRGLLPICMYCRKIRDDGNYWQEIESYFASHTDVDFNHGVCPDCADRYLRPELEQLRRQRLSREQ